MKKLAIFVEGNTELIFIEKLLFEIAGPLKKLAFTRQRARGGRYHTLTARGYPPDTTEYLVLLVDCSCDGKVKPAIRERLDRLRAEGYNQVIGLRDLYPDFELSKYDIAKKNNDLGVTDPPAHILFAVLEIEAWFLGEWSHLTKIHTALTPEFIDANLKVNLRTVKPEQIKAPAHTLDKIYKLVGAQYKKRDGDSHRIANYLDFNELYTNVRSRIPSLDRLLTKFDNFFAADVA